MTHTLNTWPNIFDRIRSGIQPFDIRANLRFSEGDTIIHKEFAPCETCRGTGEAGNIVDACPTCVGKRGTYTGRTLESTVTCVSSFKQQFNTVVLGLDITKDENP